MYEAAYAKILSHFGHKLLAQCNFKEHINQHFKHTCLLPIMTRSDSKILAERLVPSQIDTRSWRRRAVLSWSSSLNERENVRVGGVHEFIR